jgi:hypothetical protein
MRCAASFASTLRSEPRRERRIGNGRGGAFVSFCAVSLHEKRKAERRQTRRATAPHCCGSASLPDALACRRSTSGVFLEMSEHLRPASGHASWDAAATISPLDGRYPPLPVPVQCAPHSRPGLPAADAQSRPGAACNSRPRAPPSLPNRAMPSRPVLHRARIIG